MKAAGYRAKRVCNGSDWLKSGRVVDVYSVSSCLSKDDFNLFLDSWQHNSLGFFDSPEVIRRLARELSVDLTGTRLFYYEVYPEEFDDVEGSWVPFAPEPAYPTGVVPPPEKTPEGYDVVSSRPGPYPGCSPLSCNGLAVEIETNRHCLLDDFDQTRRLLEAGKFKNSEPGPYRIFAVYSIGAGWDFAD